MHILYRICPYEFTCVASQLFHLNFFLYFNINSYCYWFAFLFQYIYIHMLGNSDCGGDSTDSYWRLRLVSAAFLLDFQWENTGSWGPVCHVCHYLLMTIISETGSYFPFIALLQLQSFAGPLVWFEASNCGKLSKLQVQVILECLQCTYFRLRLIQLSSHFCFLDTGFLSLR